MKSCPFSWPARSFRPLTRARRDAFPTMRFVAFLYGGRAHIPRSRDSRALLDDSPSGGSRPGRRRRSSPKIEKLDRLAPSEKRLPFVRVCGKTLLFPLASLAHFWLEDLLRMGDPLEWESDFFSADVLVETFRSDRTSSWRLPPRRFFATGSCDELVCLPFPFFGLTETSWLTRLSRHL